MNTGGGLGSQLGGQLLKLFSPHMGSKMSGPRRHSLSLSDTVFWAFEQEAPKRDYLDQPLHLGQLRSEERKLGRPRPPG